MSALHLDRRFQPLLAYGDLVLAVEAAAELVASLSPEEGLALLDLGDYAEVLDRLPTGRKPGLCVVRFGVPLQLSVLRHVADLRFDARAYLPEHDSAPLFSLVRRGPRHLVDGPPRAPYLLHDAEGFLEVRQHSLLNNLVYSELKIGV